MNASITIMSIFYNCVTLDWIWNIDILERAMPWFAFKFDKNVVFLWYDLILPNIYFS